MAAERKRNKATANAMTKYGKRDAYATGRLVTVSRNRFAVYDRRMAIRVEFYGIPRRRAGTSETSVEACASGAVLRDVLREVGCRFPELAAECFDGEQLRAGFAVNVRGERFVTDPDTPLNDEDAVLILSADAGG